MAEDLEFLEEMSFFLERQVLTPRSSLRDGELDQLRGTEEHIPVWKTFSLPAPVDSSGSENDKGTSSDSSSPRRTNVNAMAVATCGAGSIVSA